MPCTTARSASVSSERQIRSEKSTKDHVPMAMRVTCQTNSVCAMYKPMAASMRGMMALRARWGGGKKRTEEERETACEGEARTEGWQRQLGSDTETDRRTDAQTQADADTDRSAATRTERERRGVDT
eukprot:2993582-Rhodomonas_salina.2